uniref:Alpha-(1,6)-fucosyltransferase N- and catalytic domain-containing protein n=1 Tax=Pyramimonas obovata TaxID=1411642 RepID=A0A7S0N6K9_9CHLO|mmetsp:Transcript_21934/g.48166  ORF Transcript_21934/g.48166 Transcript_21934/m.48166 type:complete len:561 (+) Transcript_21934:271-1953(+)|eukprot:CAMPEP_0118955318 /NCGR_PEP_ID=MMETSP1169-20130426/59775_1 /TAXON_ID=36882 /ORGANISM="Pyramimonas obovata, Strain CCMP722" /LENGTH=560 /DNA_ID=CAMNT_0006903139 /DNA_START=204 /DNA_END=1886 /DNA_ORIENTATION=-
MGFLGIRAAFWAALLVTFVFLMSILGPLKPAFHYILHRPLRWNPVSDADLDSPTLRDDVGNVESSVALQPRLMLGERLHVVGSEEGEAGEEASSTEQAAGLLQHLEFDGPAHGRLDETYTHESSTEDPSTEESIADESTTDKSITDESTADESITVDSSTAEESSTDESSADESTYASHEDNKLCEPDKFGNDCSADIRTVTRYLPDEDPASIELAQSRWNPQAWDQLMNALSEMQSVNCESARVHYGLIGANARGAGLASTLRYMTAYLSDAFVEGRGFMFAGRLNYAGTKSCKSRGQLGDFECFFKPLSACSEERSTAFAKYVNPKAKTNRCMRNIIGQRCSNVKPYLARSIPAQYAPRGNFWWRSAMAAYVARVNEATAAELNLAELKASIGFQHPIIGVHVRHGDSCHTTTRKGTCVGLAHYLPHIQALAEKYNTTRVYLATDDAAVVREAAANSDFQFLVAPANRNVLQSATQIEYRAELWDGTSDTGHGIALSALQDTLLLAEADYLVAHLRSNLSRMALELSAAAKQRPPPFISMDGPWCPHWRMCEDRYNVY